MNKSKNAFEKKKRLPETIANVGLTFAKIGANSGCCLFLHQPKKPDLKKLRKF